MRMRSPAIVSRQTVLLESFRDQISPCWGHGGGFLRTNGRDAEALALEAELVE